METGCPLRAYRYTHIDRDGTTQERSEEILTEYSAVLCVNGTPTEKITCLEEHLELLILGRLRSEGLISSIGELAELTISDRIDVRVTGRTVRRMLPVLPIFWKTEWIFALADSFAAGMPLHEKTWATHSCILAKDGQILFACEDIGRHNALDKAIGFALKHDIALTQCMVYSSGRIPTDMASKAIRAGIPILISKAAPTAAAIDLARAHNLTLICAARRDRMKVFSGTLPEKARKEPVQ